MKVEIEIPQTLQTLCKVLELDPSFLLNGFISCQLNNPAVLHHFIAILMQDRMPFLFYQDYVEMLRDLATVDRAINYSLTPGEIQERLQVELEEFRDRWTTIINHKKSSHGK